jgi:glycine/D-amino acid oxidase-like deaminating enzyme
MRSEFLNKKQLADRFGIHKSAAILSTGNGEADPLKLVAGLWRSFIKRGGQVTIPFEVVDIEESRSRVAILSTAGQRIFAMHAIFCTGYELPKCVRPTGYAVHSTWALATEPQPNRLWPERALIWAANDPYLYLRTTVDGRVLAGGADEPFADEIKRDRLVQRKKERIAREASRIFPGIDFRSEYAWTGNFGVSTTGLPRIGLTHGNRRTYVVLGFGGNGITFSMLAAEIVSRAVNGLKDPDADIFAV